MFSGRYSAIVSSTFKEERFNFFKLRRAERDGATRLVNSLHLETSSDTREVRATRSEEKEHSILVVYPMPLFVILEHCERARCLTCNKEHIN